MAGAYKNTPPAAEDKGAMTAENLAAALAGESQASQKYLAFADVADAEGFPNVARLFRAVAYAESTHARNHLSVLGGIGTTADNLKAAWGGETFEIAEMYPAYDAVAKLQGNESAQTSISYALKAEVDHQGIYDSTLKGLEGKKDLGATAVRVCPICGHTVIGDAPDECPQCGTAGSHFVEF
ncbi:rubrerythrin family protein [Zavarzinia sp.]|uniref:rubrerythrin family protein n=1 Tax=Zavarzinia sp. TaxID=2027920 RepID=UPI00356434EE